LRSNHSFRSTLPAVCKYSLLVDRHDKRVQYSLERAEIFEKMYRAPSIKSIWPITELAYTAPSMLILKQKSKKSKGRPVKPIVISSDNEVRQGDPLSALLFALTVRDMFHEAGSQCKDGAHQVFKDERRTPAADS
jgi:hypothetical protein